MRKRRKLHTIMAQRLLYSPRFAMETIQADSTPQAHDAVMRLERSDHKRKHRRKSDHVITNTAWLDNLNPLLYHSSTRRSLA